MMRKDSPRSQFRLLWLLTGCMMYHGHSSSSEVLMMPLTTPSAPTSMFSGCLLLVSSFLAYSCCATTSASSRPFTVDMPLYLLVLRSSLSPPSRVPYPSAPSMLDARLVRLPPRRLAASMICSVLARRANSDVSKLVLRFLSCGPSCAEGWLSLSETPLSVRNDDRATSTSSSSPKVPGSVVPSSLYMRLLRCTSSRLSEAAAFMIESLRTGMSAAGFSPPAAAGAVAGGAGSTAVSSAGATFGESSPFPQAALLLAMAAPCRYRRVRRAVISA
mmetsp:Transcript_11003/g.38194  ORF Transcript_11003/g.38194 Transcript_11003/m.38194 type:complete len:274 (-) Transcript_11003:54-875(-)